VAVRSTYGRLLAETLHSRLPRAWLPFGPIADAISSRLDVIPELTTIKKADLWALG
jgi:hypothetical protein